MDPTNALRTITANGTAALGARASSFNPALVEIYGGLGLDFVWLDFEHAGPSPYDSTTIENLTRAADVAGIELLVRLPNGDPALVRKVLDAGVRTVLIPRVTDAREVRRAVEATRFEYDGAPGQRGLASGRSAGYGDRPDSYTDAEDERVMVGVMIETRQACENLAEILEVPGLGFAFVGPGDLSVSFGHPDRPDHPRVREAIADVEERVAASDAALGGIGHDGDVANGMIDRGYDLIRLGGEFESVRSTLADRLAAIEDA